MVKIGIIAYKSDILELVQKFEPVAEIIIYFSLCIGLDLVLAFN